MDAVLSVYTDQKKTISGAKLKNGFFDEVIHIARENTSILDIDLSKSDKTRIYEQYAKSINAPLMAMTCSENNLMVRMFMVCEDQDPGRFKIVSVKKT